MISFTIVFPTPSRVPETWWAFNKQHGIGIVICQPLLMPSSFALSFGPPFIYSQTCIIFSFLCILFFFSLFLPSSIYFFKPEFIYCFLIEIFWDQKLRNRSTDIFHLTYIHFTHSNYLIYLFLSKL